MTISILLIPITVCINSHSREDCPCASMEGNNKMCPNLHSEDFKHFVSIESQTKFIFLKYLKDYTWDTLDNIYSTHSNYSFPY